MEPQDASATVARPFARSFMPQGRPAQPSAAATCHPGPYRRLPADRLPGYALLVVAAGNSSRFGGTLPKQYLQLAGRSLLDHALDHPPAQAVMAVISPDHLAHYRQYVGSYPNLLPPVSGGGDRQQSVLLGLRALAALPHPPEFVLIHDAARPCVPAAVFERVASAAQRHGGAFAALTSVDSLHQCDAQGVAMQSLDRSQVMRAQTPQGFRLQDILAAHEALQDTRFTDDVALALAAGLPVVAVAGDPAGSKVTYADDLPKGEAGEVAAAKAITDCRTGIGYDVHAFAAASAEGRTETLMLGGLAIPHDRRLEGHSDADVLLHSITDALLGALGDGDIGDHFPPSDPQWKGAESAFFLQHAVALALRAGWEISHVDSTTICEAPRLSGLKERLRQRIAEIMSLDAGRVSVKATTSERLGFTGRREGIAVAASVTLVKRG